MQVVGWGSCYPPDRCKMVEIGLQILCAKYLRRAFAMKQDIIADLVDIGLRGTWAVLSPLAAEAHLIK